MTAETLAEDIKLKILHSYINLKKKNENTKTKPRNIICAVKNITKKKR